MNNSISNYVKSAQKDEWSCLILSMPESTKLSELPAALTPTIHMLFQMEECEIPRTRPVEGVKLFGCIVCQLPDVVATYAPMLNQLGWTIEGLQTKENAEDIVDDEGNVTSKPAVHTPLSSDCLKYFYDVDQGGNQIAATAFPVIQLVGGAEPIETE